MVRWPEGEDLEFCILELRQFTLYQLELDVWLTLDAVFVADHRRLRDLLYGLAWHDRRYLIRVPRNFLLQIAAIIYSVFCLIDALRIFFPIDLIYLLKHDLLQVTLGIVLCLQLDWCLQLVAHDAQLSRCLVLARLERPLEVLTWATLVEEIVQLLGILLICLCLFCHQLLFQISYRNLVKVRECRTPSAIRTLLYIAVGPEVLGAILQAWISILGRLVPHRLELHHFHVRSRRELVIGHDQEQARVVVIKKLYVCYLLIRVRFKLVRAKLECAESLVELTLSFSRIHHRAVHKRAVYALAGRVVDAFCYCLLIINKRLVLLILSATLIVYLAPLLSVPQRRVHAIIVQLGGDGARHRSALSLPWAWTDAPSRPLDLLVLVQGRFEADCIDVLEIGENADLRLRSNHEVLVLELVLASKSNFSSLAEVDELYLKLIIIVHYLDVKTLIRTVAWLFEHLSSASLITCLDCFEYCLRLL